MNITLIEKILNLVILLLQLLIKSGEGKAKTTGSYDEKQMENLLNNI